MIFCPKILRAIFRSRINYILLIALFLAEGEVVGQEMPVPASTQGELIPKILLLNKNFVNKPQIKLGIIFNKYSRSSAEAADVLIDKIKSPAINIKIRTVLIELSEIDNITETLNDYEFDAIYIAPLRGINLASIRTYCRTRKIVSFCGTPELVADYFSVGFDLVDNKVKIYINLKSALEEGADFSSRLLKIAQVTNK